MECPNDDCGQEMYYGLVVSTSQTKFTCGGCGAESYTGDFADDVMDEVPG